MNHPKVREVTRGSGQGLVRLDSLGRLAASFAVGSLPRSVVAGGLLEREVFAGLQMRRSPHSRARGGTDWTNARYRTACRRCDEVRQERAKPASARAQRSRNRECWLDGQRRVHPPGVVSSRRAAAVSPSSGPDRRRHFTGLPPLYADYICKFPHGRLGPSAIKGLPPRHSARAPHAAPQHTAPGVSIAPRSGFPGRGGGAEGRCAQKFSSSDPKPSSRDALAARASAAR